MLCDRIERSILPARRPPSFGAPANDVAPKLRAYQFGDTRDSVEWDTSDIGSQCAVAFSVRAGRPAMRCLCRGMRDFHEVGSSRDY
jgi:hypothetical protein